MKILVPIFGFSRSGGKRVLSALATEMIRRGHEVDFLVPESSSKPYFPTSGRILAFDDHASLPKFVRNMILLVKLTWNVALKSKYYDFVLATHNLTTYPILVGVRDPRKRLYYIQAYEPEYCSRSLSGRILRILAKLSYNLNFLRIVNAPLYLNYEEIKATKVLEPGIDLSTFNSKARSRSLQDEIFVVGCIGRKDPWKGTHQVIGAFLKARPEIERMRRVKVVMHLAFELPDELAENLPDGIEVMQPHGDHNLAQFYSNLDVLIATGLVQSGAFHYPCMEGLACGPLVISNYAPATNFNSYYLEQVNEKAISDALIECSNPDWKRPSQREDTVAKYAWDSVGEKFEQILLEFDRKTKNGSSC